MPQGRRQKRKRQETPIVTGEYAFWRNVPSNVVFSFVRKAYVGEDLPPLTGWQVGGLYMRLVEDDYTVSDVALCSVVRSAEQVYKVIEIVRSSSPSPFLESLPVGEFKKQGLNSDEIKSCKVEEVLPFTETRMHQLAYMFVKVLLHSKGINLARSTHRQFGQWASAISVSIDILKAAARPLIREMQTNAFATVLDEGQRTATVEATVTQERTNELAFLFVKWLLRTYGIRISERSTEGQLKQWAKTMGVPIDELKLALRPLIEEIETEVFTPKAKK